MIEGPVETATRDMCSACRARIIKHVGLSGMVLIAIPPEYLEEVDIMNARNGSANRASQADEISSLRARDVQHVSSAGIEVTVAEEEPATRLQATHGRTKIVQRERFHTLRWYLVFIFVLLVITVILGFQLL